MKFGKKLCESCCDIYQNDDWTKQSGFMSSDPPAGRYFQSRGTSWTWPKKCPDSSPWLSIDRTNEKTQIINLHLLRSFLSLSLSLYIYYTHITNHVVHPKWMLNVNYISIKNNILKRKVSNTEQIILKLNMFGTSLVAQWLRPSAFNSGGTGSIPGWILMMHCESENFW